MDFKSIQEVKTSAAILPEKLRLDNSNVWNSIRLLLNKGLQEYNANKKEKAYFHIFRCFEILQQVQKQAKFKRNEAEFFKVIGGREKLNNAMNILEELERDLRFEYEALNPPKVVPVPIKKEPSLREKVSVKDLMQLKEKDEKDFLLCEVRSQSDYLDNHVNWKESILIPPGILRSDIIPQKLQEILPEESMPQFAARFKKDYIIFMDNFSEKIEDSLSLRNLKKILTEWEGSRVHHNIIICEGGFDKFSMAYPLYTTKKTKSRSTKPLSSKMIDITNLSYPEVGSRKTLSPSPPQSNAKSSPAFSSGAISLSPTMPKEPIAPSSRATDFKPYVPDRSLKANLINNTEQNEGDEDSEDSQATNGGASLYPTIKSDNLDLPTVNKKPQESEIESINEGSDALQPSQGSTINRSYSSPNIAQLAEKEEDELSPSSIIPRIHVDRSTKPSSQIKRNFDHIWSSGQTKRGLTGLKNLGNTCYMNSILQCISNFTVMARYFLEKKYINDINKKSETHGHIANEYSALLQQMWSGNVKSISPNDMKRVIGKYNSSFSGFDQQDAHEFFIAFMLWLHNDVNEIQEKIALPEQKTDNAPSKKAAAKKAWDHELRVDKSFIRTTFYGQRKSTLQCLSCNYESCRYDSFIELSLELPPGNRKVTLSECIKLYLDPVYVTWTCSKCKHNGRSLKKFDLVKLPLILTIHLARFFNDGLWRKKQNVVEFDLEHVDFGRYVTSSEEGTLNTLSDFSLYGVCNHFGSMEGGHYTAYCYSQVYSKWHKYDDNEVHEIDRSKVVTAAAYVLFYAAMN